MALVGQVYVAHVVLGTVETVDALQIWKFEGGDGAGPVATVADNEHGFGGHDGSQFGLAGASGSELYGFAALARAAAIEMRGQMDDRG